MAIKLSLGERMVVMRMRLQITQEELGAILGCVRKTVYRAEHGQRVGKSIVARFEILEGRQVGRQGHGAGSQGKRKVGVPV